MRKLTELAWSLLDDRPLIVEDEETSLRLCCWAGVPMDFKTGLLIYARCVINIGIGSTMAEAAAQDFEQAHALGFFDHDIAVEYDRDSYYNGVMTLMNRRSPEIFLRLKKYQPQDLLACFMQSHRSVREYSFEPGVEHAF